MASVPFGGQLSWVLTDWVLGSDRSLKNKLVAVRALYIVACKAAASILSISLQILHADSMRLIGSFWSFLTYSSSLVIGHYS